MRIIQLLVLIVLSGIGTWAKLYHAQIVEQLETECGIDGGDTCGPFDQQFGRPHRSQKNYTPAEPSFPSAVQANPYLK